MTMHPLNHKERQDKFFNFIVLFTTTLVLTIVAIYSTNAMLTDAMSRGNAVRINQYFSYRQHQQDYVNQLTTLNEALTARPGERAFRGAYALINNFQNTYLKNQDSPALMPKIADTYNLFIRTIEARNQAREDVNTRQKEYDKCQAARTNPN
jgi:LPS O-antigen subunit length determinant protein (WzzB/FepE family)